MRPIFCGNFEYDARQSDLERLFRRYGKVDRVDMKSGFAFVYMEDERDAEDAIRALDRIEFGRKGRRLRVEWTKQERSSRRPESSKKSSSNTRPSKTLFVINFDPYHTRTRDLERHFDPYGKILNIRVRRNFAFIQFETLEDASKALEATNMSKLLDRVITVEFAIKDDDDRRNGNSPDRVRDRSPRRGGYDRARSQSPYRRERDSPDYGHGRGRSPSPYRRERGSPDYARGHSQSPIRKDRGSPNRKERGSPIRRERGSPNRRERGSPVRRERGSPDRRVRGSPDRRVRGSPDRRVRGSPDRRERGSPDRREMGSPDRKDRSVRRDHELSPSPNRKEEGEADYNHNPSSSPPAKRSNGDIGNGVNPGKSASPEYGHRAPSASPQIEEGERVPNIDDYPRDRTPAYSDADSPPPDRFRSQSPVTQERERERS